MKYKVLAILCFVIFSQWSFSQERFKTLVEVSQVQSIFSKGEKIVWQLPVSSQNQSQLVWYERPNSLKGIRTFLAYNSENQMVGSLSIDNVGLSGNVHIQGIAYKILSEEGFVIIEKEDDDTHHKCGVCAEQHQPVLASFLKKNPKILSEDDDKCKPDANGFLNNDCLDNMQIYTDGILRVYRLALLVNYDKFQSEFNKDKSKVRRFWAETEAFANELYIRDVGVKFKIVDDDRLIIDSAQNEIFKNVYSGTQMVENQKTTKEMNKILGEENYDVGLIHIFLAGVNGQAALDAVNSRHSKADGVFSRANPSTVAHELGHMFGADHTFERGADTAKVEPGSGRSIMGYGHSFARDFFTLYSIYSIRTALTRNSVYFSDAQRTQKVELNISENPVYGIKTNNRRPVIDISEFKKKYTIPKETYFQFRIKATDPNNDKLIYYAHQTDIRRQTLPSNAYYYSAKPSYNNLIQFQTEYHPNGGIKDYFPNAPQGVYRFWLAASDGILGNEVLTNEAHATQFDMYITDVEVKNGTAFKITGGIKKKYTAGEQVTLTWSVDNTIFSADSKVRILLSDDFGKTFQHTITAETPNNGSFTFTMPHLNIAKQGNRGNGLFKIEVLDHIAYAMSDYNPQSGGFELTSSNIYFEEVPEATIYVKEGNLPQNQHITAKTSCANNHVTIQHSDQIDTHLVKRTFIATDTCGNQATFVQHIYVEENVPPLQFVGNLPQDEVYYCDSELYKTPPTLSYVGGKNPTLQLVQTRMEAHYHTNYILKRTWRLTDPVAQSIEHTQLIYVYDSKQPILVTQPQDVYINNEWEVYNYMENPPVYYDNCGNELLWSKSQEHKTDADGNKVIEVTWKVLDGSYNQTSVTQRFIVKNTTEMYFQHLPTDITLSCYQVIPSADIELKVVNCNDATISHTENISIQNGVKTITRVYTATGCGKTISQTQIITVTDNQAPVFVGKLPENISVATQNDVSAQEDIEAIDNCTQGCSDKRAVIRKKKIIMDIYTGQSKEVITWEYTGNDSCNRTANVSKNRQQNGNIITDTWTATDAFGNTISHSRTITINSISQPQVSFSNFPSAEHLPCGSPIPTALTTIEIAGCSGIQSVNVSHSDQETGDCQTGKTITRTYTATACNQTIAQVQTISIAGDREKPRFEGTLPSDISVNENESIPAQEDLTATDNCSQNVVVTKNRTQNGNTITDTWTATDNCGNITTHSRTITIVPVMRSVHFSNFPDNQSLPCGSSIPTALTTIEITGCSGVQSVNVSHSDQETGDCQTGKTITRTYTAVACGQTIAQVQTISIAGDREKPRFEGTLPSDISVNENESIPAQEDLTATDNCSQNVVVTKNRTQNGNTITDTWTATDDCGNTATHSRTITLLVTPSQGGNTPSIRPKVPIYNVVSLGVSSENYLRIEPIEDFKDIDVQVFSELGDKVFESRDYQRTGKVFRGYANVSGVFGTGKRLPSGTYFYIMKYKDKQGKNHTQTGYLLVR